MSMFDSIQQNMKSFSHDSASFFEDTGRSLGLKANLPETYAYSYSSRSKVTPEDVNVGETIRDYTDSHGNTKREVVRNVNNKSMTTTWVTTDDAKEKCDKNVKLSNIEKQEVQDFEAEWEKKSLKKFPFDLGDVGKALEKASEKVSEAGGSVKQKALEKLGKAGVPKKMTDKADEEISKAWGKFSMPPIDFKALKPPASMIPKVNTEGMWHIFGDMGSSLGSFGHEADRFFESIHDSAKSKLSSNKKKKVPSHYSYDLSSFTAVSPENGTISQIIRQYTDSHGLSKKEVKRTLDEKSITKTWALNEKDEKVGQPETVLEKLTVEQMKDFEAEWEKKSKADKFTETDETGKLKLAITTNP